MNRPLKWEEGFSKMRPTPTQQARRGPPKALFRKHGIAWDRSVSKAPPGLGAPARLTKAMDAHVCKVPSGHARGPQGP